MDDQAANRGATANVRREPHGLTIADLLLLIVGFAFAISLPQLHHLDDALAELGAFKIPMPGWSAELLVVQEAAMKCSLAIVPVILARRFRYGGLPRPADWLAILVVLPWFREAMFRRQGIPRFARWCLVDFRSWLGFSVEVLPQGAIIQVGKLKYGGYEGFPVGFTPMDEYRLWCGCAAIIFVGFLTALGIGRRRIPAWVKTAILPVVAFAGLELWNYFHMIHLLERSYAVSRRVGLPMDVAYQIAVGLCNLPQGLLFGGLVVAALLDLRRGGRKRWVWTGWVGLAATLVVLAAGVGIDASEFPFEASLATCRQFASLFLRWFVAGLAGWIIVERAGRAAGDFGQAPKAGEPGDLGNSQ